MRFLIIDDSPADRELVVLRLRREFPEAEFVQVDRAERLDESLTEEYFDIVLTDYQLNWTNGLHVLSQVKLRYPEVPVLMVTGTGSEEVAVEGLRSGLSNYILKSHLDRLPQAVHESLERARLQRQYEQAIEQLRASEERYREIFEQGLTAIFAATPEGELRTCNAAFLRIFGFTTEEEALGANMRELYCHHDHYQLFLDKLMREKRLNYHEIEMKRRDGHLLYVVENVVGTFDEQGRLSEIKGYIFDITERRKLANQLQQAQRLESVGLLVSGIAHDFNNMLGGILGYSSRGLARITTSHPLYNDLSRIYEIGGRAARMTQQLLAFSRRQMLEPTNVNLNVVVDNLLSFLSKILEDHIDFTFEPESDLKTVYVDPGQMEQVLMNLCVNAHDAMPEGGKLIIRTANVAREMIQQKSRTPLEAPYYVQISVQDTGIGMDEATKAQIFEPFFTTKEIGKGTGLGLSMVHGIIGQHNGFIDVESVPGEGTTFTLYLPTVEASAQQITPIVAERRDIETLQGGNEVILVVEDDPDLRCLMEEALGEYGYTVVSASDGFEGWQLFQEREQEIALVVSDLMTPKMKGKELYNAISERRPETRFLFVSGYQANQISQNFVLDKGFAFLPKPFDLDELAAKVREVLG
ncbi:hybrid sensor histidine kinase/response regulator [Tengunoibacter tsumagoiensis]|uniref:histidine kinase n=1 Tax=Tengunoibacter tsumagoiensis TaxID=2014871 RepID=A0A402A2F1_9CHLR|nr:hybrid sensor histidine kinase/response regulator [Tengunoibacter tsumagoiensis]GCE13323.1 hypothetical protein KTT_31820 [Tengunoibacter tsumagoiensis]